MELSVWNRDNPPKSAHSIYCKWSSFIEILESCCFLIHLRRQIYVTIGKSSGNKNTFIFNLLSLPLQHIINAVFLLHSYRFLILLWLVLWCIGIFFCYIDLKALLTSPPLAASKAYKLIAPFATVFWFLDYMSNDIFSRSVLDVCICFIWIITLVRFSDLNNMFSR